MPIQDTSNAIKIDTSKHGRGIFATRDITIHEEFYQYTGTPIDYPTCQAMGADECYPIQINDVSKPDAYLLSDAPGCYINHKCNTPNAGLNGKSRLVALRDIKKEEEVCFDYSTSMLERSWTMLCACGEVNCRGLIEDFDKLPTERQQAYIHLGVVQPFILEWLEKSSATKSNQ